MGRHSASDGDGDGDGDEVAAETVAAPVPEPATVTGRHATVDAPPAPEPRPEEEPLVELADVAAGDGPLGLIAEQMVEADGPAGDRSAAAVQAPPSPTPSGLEPASPGQPAAALPGMSAAPAAEPVPAPRRSRGNQSTAADLALLREHSAVRARVIAALVVPFVLYSAVLLLIGAVGVYLIWIWLPLVTAGVVAGGILDTEHRRRADSAADSAADPASD